MSSSSDSAGLSRRPSRRVLVAAAALAVVVLVGLGLWAATSGGDGQEDAAGPATSSSASAPLTTTPAPGTPTAVPTNPPTPVPSGPTEDASVGPPTLPPVGLTEEADTGEGFSGRLLGVEEVQGDGQGPGNVDGPALRLTVELSNGTAGPVSLDAVAVELYTGADLVPASPLDDDSASPFRGTVAPGQSATGVYVFTVADNARSEVTVQVGYQAGAPYLSFQGAVS